MVSKFKGKMLINIREFYDDKTTGEEKPGNKGIALSVEQWEALKSQVCNSSNISILSLSILIIKSFSHR